MKKFTTKQLAIAFVAIAFVFIFGFTAYRGVTGQFEPQPTISKEVKSTTKKKETSKTEETTQIESKEESKKTDMKSSDSSSKQETKKQETKKTETKSSSSKQESKKQETKKIETKSSSTKQETKKTETNNSSNKQETSAPQQVETPVKQTVSVQVIGINTTMMQGNIEVNSSSTAYSVLRELAKQNGKSISTKGFGSTVYVSGIDGLKEFDHGPSSGWMYKVNGIPPNIGAGAYKVKAGDTVIWYYVNAEQ